jgi:hypothetical protein
VLCVTRSIHWPDKSERAERFLSVASEGLNACDGTAEKVIDQRHCTALPPTIQRIAGSCRRHSAVIDILVSGQGDRIPIAAANQPARGGRSCPCVRRRASYGFVADRTQDGFSTPSGDRVIPILPISAVAL